MLFALKMLFYKFGVSSLSVKTIPLSEMVITVCGWSMFIIIDVIGLSADVWVNFHVSTCCIHRFTGIAFTSVFDNRCGCECPPLKAIWFV